MTAIVKSFEVKASPDHAFEVWTTKVGMWWPRDHTMGGEDHLDVVFDPPSGRIYERTRGGVEIEWGSIIEWSPPNRIVYSWHLFFPPAEATTVAVTFEPAGDVTRVRIDHSGFEGLGAAGPPRQQRTGHVWDLMATLYTAALYEEN